MLSHIRHYRQNIRQDCIQKSIGLNGTANKADYRQIKPTKRFIGNLFNKYQVQEFSIHFYDADKDYDFAKGLSDAEFLEKKIQYNTWIDVFGPGIWNMSQKEADKVAKQDLNSFRKMGRLSGRCWLWTDGKVLHLYCYGRDLLEYDLHFIMLRKDRVVNETRIINIPKELLTVDENYKASVVRYELKDKKSGNIIKNYFGKDIKGSFWHLGKEEKDKLPIILDRKDLAGAELDFSCECMSAEEFDERYPDEQ